MSKQLTNPHYYLQTYSLAKSGIDFDTIAQSLDPPVKRKTFLRWYNSDPALKQAYEKGRADFDPMAEATEKLTNPSQMAFLVAYAETGTINTSLQCSGMDRRQYNRWLHEPNFAAAMQTAKEMFADRLVTAAVNRAVEGIRRYKFHKGMPIWKRCSQTHPEAVAFLDDQGKTIWQYHYYEVEYSDRLLELLLSAKVQEFKELKLQQNNINIQNNNSSNILDMKQLLDEVESARSNIIDAESVKTQAKLYIESSIPSLPETLAKIDDDDDDEIL